MLGNLMLGLPIMVICLMLQAQLLIVAFRYYIRHGDLVDNASAWASFWVVTGVMLLLVIGNLGQVAIWAGVFMSLGEFQQIEVAFYHSAVNFGSLGYGDIVMSEENRLLGALEAINGVLMIGVSTAALMSAFQNATSRMLKHRQKSNVG